MNAHAQTIWTHLRDRLVSPPAPPGRPWRASAPDARLGSVTLRGTLSPCPGADTIAVIVHGLGGHVDSGYCRRAAMAARQCGMASLRLHLRGADRSGEGLYHAGLTSDVEAALASPELSEYARIVVLGFSLGGHVALRLALAPAPRLAGVAAVCSPLDLQASCRIIDDPSKWIYRRHLLRGLYSVYAGLASRCDVPLDPRAARRVQRIREWDDKVIAPWFGFANAEDYYAQQSVGPRLGDLGVPALYVLSEDDPVIAADAVRPALAATDKLTVCTARGGHVGFRPDLDLGHPGPLGVAGQLLGWLDRRG